MKIKGRSTAGAETFAAFVKDKHPQITTVVIAESIEAAFSDADIVIHDH